MSKIKTLKKKTDAKFVLKNKELIVILRFFFTLKFGHKYIFYRKFTHKKNKKLNQNYKNLKKKKITKILLLMKKSEVLLKIENKLK